MQLPAAPQKRRQISPSGGARLLSCGLRFAYETSGSGGAHVGSPASRLGEVCHDVLGDAAAGRLGAAAADEWRGGFDAQWDARVAEHAEPGEEPRRWRNFAKYRAQARVVARRLCEEIDEGTECVPEQWLESADGALVGRADLIVRSPVHEIRDYKTGVIYETPGVPRTDYLRQLLIYAALEGDRTGDLPESVRLVPLEPKVEEFCAPVSEEAAAAARDEVTSALEAFNTTVVSGGDSLALATPSPSSCRFCSWAPRCPAFWAAADPDWSADGVSAVAGVVEKVEVAHDGGVAVQLLQSAGTFADATVVVTPVEPTGLPPIEGGISPGDIFAGVGLRSRGPGLARTTAYAQFAWQR